MNAIIRVDASIQIGSGHVMRCLTLAEILKDNGFEVVFICRAHVGNLIEYIRSRGYQVEQLDCSVTTNFLGDLFHSKWLGVTQCEDAKETLQVLRNYEKIDLLIVDHYALDEKWESQIRCKINTVFVIDDLADRKHDCDILLDQNYYENLNIRYTSLVPSNCKHFLGPKYALLRKEFQNIRGSLRCRNGRVKRILLFFGGSDPTNETMKAIHAFLRLNRTDMQVDVVVGSSNIHKEEIENVCCKYDTLTFHYQVNNMAELMNTADLCIGAGGTATWERCFVGLPTILITIAENQELIAKTLNKNQVIFYLGPKEEVTEISISLCLERLIKDSLRLKKMELLSKELMGKGQSYLQDLIYLVEERIHSNGV